MYIKKQSQPFHIILNICKSIVNKNCFWLLFDLFQTTSETEFFRSYLVEQMKSTKNQFWVLFHSAKSISDHFRTFKNFENFFQKNRNFYVSTPILLRWKKWSQQKITFECFFIAQNPFQTILGLWKTLKNFRKNFWIFSQSRTKHEFKTTKTQFPSFNLHEPSKWNGNSWKV